MNEIAVGKYIIPIFSIVKRNLTLISSISLPASIRGTCNPLFFGTIFAVIQQTTCHEKTIPFFHSNSNLYSGP